MSTETDHEHDFGPMEIAPMTGNPHRKCQVEGCRVSFPWTLTTTRLRPTE